jgi:choline transport protein
MITACIVLLYLSYSVPVLCLLIRGRNNIPHGPFWLGPMGLFANIVLLLWTLFTLIMYSFPYAKPVEAGNMNCRFRSQELMSVLLTRHVDVCVVYAIVAFIASMDWLLRGRKSFVVASERKDEGVSPAPRIVDLPRC